MFRFLCFFYVYFVAFIVMLCPFLVGALSWYVAFSCSGPWCVFVFVFVMLSSCRIWCGVFVCCFSVMVCVRYRVRVMLVFVLLFAVVCVFAVFVCMLLACVCSCVYVVLVLFLVVVFRSLVIYGVVVLCCNLCTLCRCK